MTYSAGSLNPHPPPSTARPILTAGMGWPWIQTRLFHWAGRPDTSCTRHVLTPPSSGGWCRVARKAEPDSFGGGLDAGLYAELFEDVRDVHAGSLGAHVKRRVAIGPPSHDQG